MRINALEARDFAIDSLAKRLRAAELTDQAVDEVGSRMRSLYDQLWAEYEQNHGVEHPVRHWQHLAAASA
jgi:hypothetical protein